MLNTVLIATSVVFVFNTNTQAADDFTPPTPVGSSPQKQLINNTAPGYPEKNTNLTEIHPAVKPYQTEESLDDDC